MNIFVHVTIDVTQQLSDVTAGLLCGNFIFDAILHVAESC